MSSYDYISSFKIPLFLLKALGLWQQKDSSWYYRFYGRFMSFIFIELFVLFHTIHAVNNFINGSIHDLSKVISVLFTLYSTVLKSWWFSSKINKVHELLTDLKELLEFKSFGKTRRRPKLEAEIVHLTKVSNWFYILSFSSLLISFLMTLDILKDNQLFIETWFMFDYRTNNGLFWTIEITELFMILYSASLNTSIDIIFITFLGFVSAILDEISIEINSIEICVDELDKDDKKLEKLKACIQCHVKVKSIIADISKHLSFPFFVQALMSTVILCSAAFMLKSVRANQFVKKVIKHISFSVFFIKSVAIFDTSFMLWLFKGYPNIPALSLRLQNLRNITKYIEKLVPD